MKANPDTWKKKHTAFINAQFQKYRAFQKRILQMPGGKEKLIKLN